MKRIDVSTKKYPETFVIVDDDEYEILSKYKWYPNNERGKLYARRSIYPNGQKSKITISMHRQILAAQKGQICDHINMDTLDNRKCNLRLCNRSQNSQNRNALSSNSSGYKGVSWDVTKNKWQVQIQARKKHIKLGRYFCIIKAAKAYDNAAIKYHGEFARLNFPKPTNPIARRQDCPAEI